MTITTANPIFSGLSDAEKTNLNHFLCQHLVLVEPATSGMYPGIPILNEWLQGAEDAELRKQMKPGFIPLLPDAKEKALRSARARLHNAVKKFAVIGKYMTYADLENGFKPIQEEVENECSAIVAGLVQDWPEMMQEFKNKLHDYLVTLPNYNANLEQNLLASLPSMKEFADSFSIKVNLTPFPVVETAEFCAPVAADSMRESAQQQAFDIAIALITDALDDVNKTLDERLHRFVDNKAPFDGKVAKSLSCLAERIAKTNLLRNPLVEDIIIDLNACISLLDIKKNKLPTAEEAKVDATIAWLLANVICQVSDYAADVSVSLKNTGVLAFAKTLVQKFEDEKDIALVPA